jgi:hypothetical protein
MAPWGPERGAGRVLYVSGATALHPTPSALQASSDGGAYTHHNPGGDQAGPQDTADGEVPHGLHLLCIQLPHRRTQVG